MRAIHAVVLTAAVACSGLDEGEGGIVGLEISYPRPDTIEVGETLQLQARPLDKNGDSVPATITWVTADNTVTLDPATGLLTGVAPGSARVQGSAGSLSSALVTFAVVAPADTLIIPGDSNLIVASGASTSDPMIVQVASLHPEGVLAGRSVVYAITSPDPAVDASVTLEGGVAADTFLTGTDGTVSTARLQIASGATLPESVAVEVRAVRTRGAVVPGSGRHFIARFAP